MRTKFFQLMLAALVVCTAMVFTSCSSDDKDSDIDDLSEKIIGKWMLADIEGQSAQTNWKEVITFVSSTKAYVSKSFARPENVDSKQSPKPEGMSGTPGWSNYVECDVTIEGDTVILASEGPNGSKIVNKYLIKSISASKFSCEVIHVGMVPPPDGEKGGDNDKNKKQTRRYERITEDYSAAIIGTWQGRCTSEGSVFDDGQEHRWQYKADGTYVYYVKDGDNWVPYEGNTLNEYFVDGNLLCTRWIDLGQENREWWEITINGNKMNWTALRENPDRTTFTATFEMTKVE